MKKILSIFFALPVMAALFTACSNDLDELQTPDNPQQVTYTIKAQLSEPMTRVAVRDKDNYLSVNWEVGDQILVTSNEKLGAFDTKYSEDDAIMARLAELMQEGVITTEMMSSPNEIKLMAIIMVQDGDGYLFNVTAVDENGVATFTYTGEPIPDYNTMDGIAWYVPNGADFAQSQNVTIGSDGKIDSGTALNFLFNYSSIFSTFTGGIPETMKFTYGESRGEEGGP